MHCFDKTRRLLKKSEFNNVFNQSEKIVTSDFILLYKKNTLGHPRLGLALSKKIVFKAHDRNRIKRMLRESFRKQSLHSVDIVILMRKKKVIVSELANTKLENMWGKLCQK